MSRDHPFVVAGRQSWPIINALVVIFFLILQRRLISDKSQRQHLKNGKKSNTGFYCGCNVTSMPNVSLCCTICTIGSVKQTCIHNCWKTSGEIGLSAQQTKEQAITWSITLLVTSTSTWELVVNKYNGHFYHWFSNTKCKSYLCSTVQRKA